MATIHRLETKPRRRERFAEVLTVRLADAAKALGISETAVRNEIKAGRLEARRLGRAVLVDARELRRFVENLPQAA